MRILVTGGARSGKSRHAEGLLSGADRVTYIAPGRHADGSDPDWDARVAAHRARRPAHWQTVETADLSAAITAADGPVLVDCLSTWLVALIDDGRCWDAAAPEVDRMIGDHIDALCTAVQEVPEAVLVTNEVGLGVVPAHRSGVLFRDLLGMVNQRVAESCDEVHLVISGRVLKL
ncbi:bifunctional adenosylcobinamide kinase/adenosylcobinamide-phosphate guanylyltransferase [Mycobacterium sp. Y57]|uniref:bifunctional adenosylcobinamide kinase/adenosylcobinamide-phosphate guanylyltransferase n=1 Tax=Mycolicibacterium xanthum TaxID=2796469 RepID=UPI001C8668BB|nr:bifunctional adenosylcobinamide kinase/adenosylcobinamide-phosphate guanylyltransferase [Mycolicibacterium xanthum]MBX7431798.1 bifunctional adenosylcobinamide kinase/adenosylcobinamide-phosphate guanylyltransferase [Mycolicibacterium xanthum]